MSAVDADERRAVLRRIVIRSYARWPEAGQVLARSMDALRPWQALRTRNAINLVHYPPAIAGESYPVEFVVGLRSWWRSVRFAEEFVAAVPRATLVRVADSNDPTPLCRPEVFNRLLADFVGRCVRRRDPDSSVGRRVGGHA